MLEISTPYSSRLSYRIEGQGAVIVLLHGFPESGTLWRKVVDSLSKKFKLVIPDFPGSGASLLERETSLEDMAHCVNAILDHEQIDRAVIAGHSMGGYAGFAMANIYPEKVAGLCVIHSTPTADDEDRKKIRLKAIELLKKGGKTAFVSQMIPNLFSPKTRTKNAALVQEQTELALEMPEESMINYYQAMIGRADYSDWLPDIKCPVQWIIGIDDSLIPCTKLLKLSYVAPINFVQVYADCGHMSMLECPDRLINDLSEFAEYCK